MSFLWNLLTVLYHLLITLGTFILALVTVSAVIFANINAKRERKTDLLRMKIDEFYYPIVMAISGLGADKRNWMNEVFLTVYKKGYLGRPKILKELPEHIDNIKRSESELDHYRSQWETFAGSVWKEYEENLKDYLKLSGVGNRKFEALAKPTWNIDFGINAYEIDE